MQSKEQFSRGLEVDCLFEIFLPCNTSVHQITEAQSPEYILAMYVSAKKGKKDMLKLYISLGWVPYFAHARFSCKYDQSLTSNLM